MAGIGTAANFNIYMGKNEKEEAKRYIGTGITFMGILGILIMMIVFIFKRQILLICGATEASMPLAMSYLTITNIGLPFFLFSNGGCHMIRADGSPMYSMLCNVSGALLNVFLDALFMYGFGWGIQGAAAATVISQAVSGIGLCIQVLVTRPEFRPGRQYWRPDWKVLKYIGTFSSLTCIQQSVMNLGILAVQGLVNSFGTAVMAAFAAAVKIDSFAYMPVQEFGNAFSTFVAQNYGADRHERIRKGIIRAVCIMAAFSVAISAIVFICADPLMRIFVSGAETEIIRIGKEYLRIEGTFYIGIGLLFMLYGYYRAICRPGMSVILTVLSLGTRVALSFALAPIAGIGELGIWWSIPIGWTLADLVGTVYYFRTRQQTVWKE